MGEKAFIVKKRQAGSGFEGRYYSIRLLLFSEEKN